MNFLDTYDIKYYLGDKEEYECKFENGLGDGLGFEDGDGFGTGYGFENGTGNGIKLHIAYKNTK